jgi:hypothetical protein
MGLSVQTVAATIGFMSQLRTSICKCNPIGSTSGSQVYPNGNEVSTINSITTQDVESNQPYRRDPVALQPAKTVSQTHVRSEHSPPTLPCHFIALSLFGRVCNILRTRVI